MTVTHSLPMKRLRFAFVFEHSDWTSTFVDSLFNETGGALPLSQTSSTNDPYTVTLLSPLSRCLP